ncbi:hypothetical protein [Campylobacter sputorum]|uniref:hypothetical protein n=1 Tax=Campylobacter sputorum TaxID=206 RepID=UPI00125FAD15|nr:hypothetical protein [Campylobacter sputorum]
MSSLKASLHSGEYNDENELDEVIIDKKNTQKISNCGTIHQVDIISCMGYSIVWNLISWKATYAL